LAGDSGRPLVALRQARRGYVPVVRERGRQAVGVVAIALNGVALLPALFLASYDHQGSSPLGDGRLLQLPVVAIGLALAVWGHLNHRLGVTLLSFVFVIGWVPLALAD
jgi:hypothetical protein